MAIPFEVLLPVYINDDADQVEMAIRSVVDQTLLPQRVVVICDGPVSDRTDVVLRNAAQDSPVPVDVVRLPENRGLGRALDEGLRHCRTEWVARMDADDVALRDRFETQFAVIAGDPDVDVVGAAIREFDDDMSNPSGVRRGPSSHSDIVRGLNFRNPFNHMTVVFRRAGVEEAGGYRDCPYYEDYYLWLRMRAAGARFRNSEEILVNVRGGDQMIERRGGVRYVKSTITFLRRVVGEGLIRTPPAVAQFVARTTSSLLPPVARRSMYLKLLRARIGD